MLVSQGHLHGDYWQDFLATTCPALLLRGSQSRVTDPALMQEMAVRRPNTQLITLNGGHILHYDDPVGFTANIRQFLSAL